jgi:hypothetical protein
MFFLIAIEYRLKPMTVMRPSIFFYRLMPVMLLFIGFAPSAARAQSSSSFTDLPKMIPASPEAASLGIYGQIPVGYYRGIPEINIPLFTVEEGKIKLPISLSYHAGGMKVEELSSSVGTGWTLNAGGAITRALKGLEDEGSGGFRYNGTIAQQMADNQLSSTDAQNYKLSLYRETMDGQPDIFYFNFGGESGKFFYGNDGKLYTSPRSDLSVEYNDANNGWIITDGNGLKYSFFVREETMTEPFVKSGSGGYTSNDAFHNWTAFYLTRIEDPFGNFVSLVYGGVTSAFRAKAIDTRNLLFGNGASCPPTTVRSFNDVTTFGARVTEIDYSSGKIVFNLGTTERLDLPGNYPLETISQYNSDNVLIKTYHLYTSSITTNNVGGCEDARPYRLRLDSLKATGSNGLALKPYIFSYNSTTPPCRLSDAQDYWGYYNGKNNSEFVRYKITMTGPYTGADKTPDINFTKAGMLEKMTYPTGGRTEFAYEPNTYAQGVMAGYDPLHTSLLDGLMGNNTGAADYHIDYQNNFTITAGSIPTPGYRLVTVAYSKYCANPSLINLFTLRISRTGYAKDLHDGDTLHLIAGTYTLSGSIETEFAGTPLCTFDCQLNETIYLPFHYNTFVYGGLRIQQIQNFDGVTNQPTIQTFNYNRFADDGTPDTVSSGDYNGLPDQNYYEYDKSYSLVTSTSGACSFHVFNSVSNYPLLGTGGTPIGYRNVTVLYGPNGTGGKEQYSYTSYTDFPLGIGLTFPFFFTMEYDWKEGLLTKKTTYSYEAGTYVPVQKKMTVYDFHDGDTTSKVSKTAMVGKTDESSSRGTDIYDLAGLYYLSYVDRAEAFNVKSDTTIIYDKALATNATKIINSYVYNSRNFQLQQQSTANSRNEVVITKKTYPLDYTITGVPNNDIAKGVQNLLSKHMINSVIEQSTQRSDAGGTNLRTISSFFLNYGLTVPAQAIVSKTENTQGLTNFVPAAITATASTTDSRYTPRLYFDRYDSKGNILAAHKALDETKTYIWDYNNCYPIAEVSGDSLAAFTSFEANGTGNWTVGAGATDATTALSGTKCHTLSNDVSRSGLSSATTYIVSYWTTNATPFTITGTISGYPVLGRSVVHNGYTWAYYEHRVTGQTTIQISGTGRIDEVRLYPNGSQMTTFTYVPLLGIQTQCDASGLPTFYEYDGLSRLLRIRDLDYNIIKQWDYQYQVTAGYSNVAKSGTFTRNNCAVGSTPTAVTYTVQAGTYVSSISQADADNRAQADVTANGQAYANANGSCVFSSIAKSGTFTRNNCGANSTPGTATYTVAAGAYTSTISQPDADAKAQNDVNTNGQNYANTHATCTANILITGVNNIGASGVTAKFTNVSTGAAVTFTITNGTIGSVPPGTYNVHFASSTARWMGFTCGSSSRGTSIDVNGVNVSDCSTVYVDTTSQSN